MPANFSYNSLVKVNAYTAYEGAKSSDVKISIILLTVWFRAMYSETIISLCVSQTSLLIGWRGALRNIRFSFQTNGLVA